MRRSVKSTNDKRGCSKRGYEYVCQNPESNLGSKRSIDTASASACYDHFLSPRVPCTCCSPLRYRFVEISVALLPQPSASINQYMHAPIAQRSAYSCQFYLEISAILSTSLKGKDDGMGRRPTERKSQTPLVENIPKNIYTGSPPFARKACGFPNQYSNTHSLHP